MKLSKPAVFLTLVVVDLARMIPSAIDVLATGRVPKSLNHAPSCSLGREDGNLFHAFIADTSGSMWATRPPQHSVMLECVANGVSVGAGRLGSRVDLSKSSMFNVGRSLKSCIQLKEITVSRKHAIIAHHSTGDTYVIDGGSAHGTYVNNVRIPPNVPKKLRRGSLVKFGGEKAPLFLFRAFERLDSLLKDIDDLCEGKYSGLANVVVEGEGEGEEVAGSEGRLGEGVGLSKLS